jgi:phage shock protein A
MNVDAKVEILEQKIAVMSSRIELLEQRLQTMSGQHQAPKTSYEPQHFKHDSHAHDGYRQKKKGGIGGMLGDIFD